jgi:HEAT repeat protein
LGEHEASAVEALTKCLKYSDSSVSRLAAEALRDLGEDVAPAVLPELTKCIEDPDRVVSSRVAAALGNLGEHEARRWILLSSRC